MSEQRVIFLDIDGPVIPGTSYIFHRMCALERRLPDYTVGVVRAMCEMTGARVVINSTHNRDFPDVDDITTCLILAGLPEEMIHPDSKTRYPDISRDVAVSEWLARHPEVDRENGWVAVDDSMFLPESDPRMVLVDFDSGVHLGHLNQVCAYFGCRGLLVLG